MPRVRLVAILLLLGVFAAALVWRYSRPAAAGAIEDFRFLPPTAVMAVHVDLAGLRNSALVRRVLLRQAGAQVEKDYAEFVRATGFDFERDLDSLALGVSGPENERTVNAVLRGRFDAGKLEPYIRSHQRGAAEHLGHTVHVFTGPTGRGFSLAFLSRDRLAFSNSPDPGEIKRMIGLGERREPAMDSRLKQLHVQKHLGAGSQAWLAVDLERGGKLSVPASRPSAGTAFTADLLRGGRMGLLAARIGDRQVELSLAAVCATADEAQRVARSLSGMRALLAALAAREKPPPDAAGAELARSLQSISIGVENSAAVVHWTLDHKLLEKMLADAPPRPAGFVTK